MLPPSSISWRVSASSRHFATVARQLLWRSAVDQRLKSLRSGTPPPGRARRNCSEGEIINTRFISRGEGFRRGSDLSNQPGMMRLKKCGKRIKPVAAQTITHHVSNKTRRFPEFPSDHAAVVTTFEVKSSTSGIASSELISGDDGIEAAP